MDALFIFAISDSISASLTDPIGEVNQCVDPRDELQVSHDL